MTTTASPRSPQLSQAAHPGLVVLVHVVVLDLAEGPVVVPVHDLAGTHRNCRGTRSPGGGCARRPARVRPTPARPGRASCASFRHPTRATDRSQSARSATALTARPGTGRSRRRFPPSSTATWWPTAHAFAIAIAQGAPHERLTRPAVIRIRRVHIVHALVNRVAHHPRAFRLVNCRAVIADDGHSHDAEPERRCLANPSLPNFRYCMRFSSLTCPVLAQPDLLCFRYGINNSFARRPPARQCLLCASAASSSGYVRSMWSFSRPS